MLKTKFRWIVGFSVLLAFALCVPGAIAAEATQEGISPSIVYQVADSAELTKVAYYFKEYKGKTVLHMELSLKNVSPDVKRYRVNIFLPEGPAAGGLYPRALKGDVKGIEAGKEMSQEFPMYFNNLPTGFTIVVKEMQ
ncbi:MAG TPA: hypothetical protein ENN79_14895 [Desulfobacteraceae bacterium]|nr:hypothetical protein [Desulfobacteraceae bacterium]